MGRRQLPSAGRVRPGSSALDPATPAGPAPSPESACARPGNPQDAKAAAGEQADGSQTARHAIAVPADALCRGVIRLFASLGQACLPEVPLANGRRADIMALDPGGAITIVEIKSCLNDFRSDQKWPEYAPFCDRFCFAVSAAFPHAVLPEAAGLIVADSFGGAVLREAPEHRLAPARRKAMTLRFARLAALRLAAPTLSAMDERGFVP